jgi:hypothetical protein
VKEMDLPINIKENFPEIFLDGELWYFAINSVNLQQVILYLKVWERKVPSAHQQQRP